MDTQTETNNIIEQDLQLIYIAAFGISATGIAAFDFYLNDAAFTIISVIAIAIGIYQSYRIRIHQKLDSSDTARYIIATAIIAYIFINIFSSQNMSFNSVEASSMTMAFIISALTIITSYFIISDNMLLFSFIPPLSLIGLTGTISQDEKILVYFIVYIIFAILVMIRISSGSGEKTKLRTPPPFKTHAVITLSITLFALLVGAILNKAVFEPINKTILRALVGPGSLQSYMLLDINDVVPVGPSPNSSDEELMTVVANEPLLYRGQTFNHYNGYSWRDTRTAKGEMLEGKIELQNLYTPLNTFKINTRINEGVRKSTRRVEQFFTITKGYYRLIFGAAEIDSIELKDRTNLLNTEKYLATSRFRGKGSSYRVVSLVSYAAPNELRSASTQYPDYIREHYLKIPASLHIPNEIINLIRSKNNPYDKAIAIQQFLENNYVYDINAFITDRNIDMVHNFLYNTKRGHCTLFASAMVLISRKAGIPARLATGFNSGEYDESRELYSISAADKHAWAELYFPSYGWISFDPTALQAAETTKDRITKAATNAKYFILKNRRNIIISVIIFLLAIYLIRTELIEKYKNNPSANTKSADAMASNTYNTMCSALSQYGYTKDPSYTPSEFADKIDDYFGSNMPWLTALVNSITADLINVRYAAKDVSESRLKYHSQSVKKLNKQLKSANKSNELFRKGKSNFNE